jgi:mycothiol system anti-sigma-R factor
MNKAICFVDEFELNVYLDRELSSNRQHALDNHLRFCEDCSARYNIAHGLKRLLRDSASNTRAPEFLRDQILGQIESAPQEGPSRFWEIARNVIIGRPLLPIGVAVLLVLVFLSNILLGPTPSNTMELIGAMVHEHDEYIEGFETEKGIESDDPQEVSQWLRSNTDSNFNLSSCGKMPLLAGACAIKERGRSVTCVFFDRGEKRVSLFMVRGKSDELKDGPRDPAGKIHQLKEKSFHCGSCTGNNYVIWSNDGIVCLLVSKIPEDSLIRIAEGLI